MRRRSYLALLAASLGAGCVSDAGIGNQQGPEPSKTPDRSATETADVDRADEPFETVSVGDPASVTDTENNRPHSIVVVNDGPARAFNLEIERAPAESDVVTSVLNSRYEFPADGWLQVELVEPVRYLVHVSVTESGQEHSLTVDRSWFDCNASAHQVTVPASGAMKVTNSSTTMACAPTDGSDETPGRTTGRTDSSETDPATTESDISPNDPTKSTDTVTN